MNSNNIMNRSGHAVRRIASNGYHDEKKMDSSPQLNHRKVSSSSVPFQSSLPMGGGGSPQKVYVNNNSSIKTSPQTVFDDENPYPKRTKTVPRKRRGGSCSFLLFVIFAAGAGYLFVSYRERELMGRQLKEQEEAMRELEVELSIKFDRRLETLAKEKADLEKNEQLHKASLVETQQWKDKYHRLEGEMHEMTEKHKNDPEHIRELEWQVQKLESYNTQLQERRQKMKEHVELMSRRALLEKYGPGPHEVEMFVRFDSNTEGEEVDGGYITLELAPVDEMPHAVYWFLEQVEHGLYDGCSFHRNAGHVVQGGPVRNFLSPPEGDGPTLEQRFTDSGFRSILFQEYSPNYPHVKYTAGYAGRPGGPDFYISTQDNTEAHGPGGQGHYEDAAEADPCFARVVHGFDVVDRMSESPVLPGDDRAMERNVAIVFMKRLLRDEH